MEYEKNEDGTLKLDANGNPILKTPVVVDPPVVPPKTPPANEMDLDKLDEATRKYILELRKENGGYRTKAKAAEQALTGVRGALGLTEDQVSPEEKAKALTAQVEQQNLNNAILQNALDQGVPSSGLKYFRHLVLDAVESLGEGEELSDTAIAALALEAKSKALPTKANSSVQPPATGTPPPGSGSGEPTIDAFVAMTNSEKTKLWTEQPEVYERLFKTAMGKKLIR